MFWLLGDTAKAAGVAESLCTLYDSLRPSMFAGFLGVSAFLFAMKTFIVPTMKREVYDSRDYQTMLAELKTVNKQLGYYDPLRNLQRFLYYSILSCLITSVLQITIGLIPYWLIAVVCILAAMVSVVFVFASVVIVNKNIVEWLNRAEVNRKNEGLDSQKTRTRE